MKLEYEGEVYDFDLEEITVGQAKMIKQHCNLTLMGLESGLADGDPDALLAIYWLMLANSGKARPIGEVDFKIVKFAKALQEATEKEEAERKAADKAAGKRPRPTVDRT